MAFATDSALFRTFDEGRGLELRRVGGGSDGDSFFEILRSDGEVVHFTSVYDRDVTDAWIAAHPGSVRPVVRVITATRGRFSDLSQSATDALIQEALEAFKFVHGQPPEADVTIIFKPAMQGAR